MKSRSALSLCAGAFAAISLLAPQVVAAKTGTSVGGGVKCTWVLVKTSGNTNVYQQVCRKSGP